MTGRNRAESGLTFQTRKTLMEGREGRSFRGSTGRGAQEESRVRQTGEMGTAQSRNAR